MSYAILITGETSQSDTLVQILIANHNNKNYCWTRTTSGGRGTSNAWFDNDYVDVIATASKNNIVGEVLSSPLTSVDTTAIENGERPNVLIQKLSKQFGLRHKNIDTTKTIADVLVEVDYILNNNPNDLDKYRSDGRKDKSVATNKSITQVVQAPTPVIRIEREQEPVAPTSEIIGDYTLLVPTKEIVGDYLPRTFVGGVDEQKMYQKALKNKYNILLEGHAGTGKTTSALHDSMVRNQGCTIVSGSAGVEIGHFIGKTIIKPNGEAGWVDGVLVQAMKTGAKIVLDELDFFAPKILQRLNDVLQNRVLTLVENGGEVVFAHPNFQVVATYNNGYKHSNSLNESLLDRFKLKLYFDYDNAIESQIIKSKTLLELANQMRNDAISGLYSTPVSLRILKTFQELASDTEIGYEFAVENFLMNFNADERPSVKLLLEAHRYNLEAELTGVRA